jgi:hypothetical protein
VRQKTKDKVLRQWNYNWNRLPYNCGKKQMIKFCFHYLNYNWNYTLPYNGGKKTKDKILPEL